MQVDASELSDVVARLRRVQGQLGGGIRMTEQGGRREAARRRVHGARPGRVHGLRQCPAGDDDGEASVDVAQREKLFLSLT